MSSPVPIYRVPDDAPAKTEAMGTKPKFWFSRDGAMWLFKATRPQQGEHWAEVAAARRECSGFLTRTTRWLAGAIPSAS